MGLRGIAGLLLLVTGIAAALWGLWVMYRDASFTGWTVKVGRVVSSSMQPVDGERFTLDVTYEYEIGGKKYTSSRYSLTPRTFPREEAERLLRRHQPERPLTLHYNPGDPSVSVVDYDYPFVAVVIAVIGILMASIGGTMAARGGLF